ncbi:MAG: hypothetical protein K6G08_07060 [Prevotella sp.]|nr:hypothetical protein [Prevotella sp.]
MGIVDWFTNDLNAEERVLTRDLLSVAFSDNEFSEEELNAVIDICRTEDISSEEMMDSIRNRKANATKLNTLEEKKRYLLHLIRMMTVDRLSSPMELHVIEVISRKIGVSPFQIIAFILEDINDGNMSKEDGLTTIGKFAQHFKAIGL